MCSGANDLIWTTFRRPQQPSPLNAIDFALNSLKFTSNELSKINIIYEAIGKVCTECLGYRKNKFGTYTKPEETLAVKHNERIEIIISETPLEDTSTDCLLFLVR